MPLPDWPLQLEKCCILIGCCKWKANQKVEKEVAERAEMRRFNVHLNGVQKCVLPKPAKMVHSDWLLQTGRLQIEFRPKTAKSDEFFKISTDCLIRLDPRTFRKCVLLHLWKLRILMGCCNSGEC